MLATVKSAGTYGIEAYPVEVVYVTEVGEFKADGWQKLAADLPAVSDVPITQLAWSMYLPMSLKLDEVRGTVPSVSAFSLFGQGERIREELQMHGAVVRKAEAASMVKELAQAQEMIERRAKALDRIRVRGVLPVRVQVPRTGQVKLFEKMLVTPQDKLHVEVDYKLRD